MRKILLGAAAVFAVAAPGVAQADVGGRVGGTYATLDEDGDPDKEDAWGVDGVVVNDLGNNWVVQLNGSLADMDHSSHTDTFQLFEGHVGYNFGGFTAGGFVSRFDWEGSQYNIIGIEGDVEFGRFGLAGAASTGEYNDGDGDISNITVTGGFALTDAWNIHGVFSHTDWDGDESDSFGLGVDYAIPNTNFTVGGGWRTFESDGGTETEAFGLSFGWNFGDAIDPMLGAGQLVPDAVLYQ